jgi:hypothetical protein
MSWLFATAAIVAACVVSASPFISKRNGKELDYSGAGTALIVCSLTALWLRLYGY